MNAQASVATGLVQSVKDSITFSRQSQKGSVLGRVPNDNPSAVQDFSPGTFPPSAAIYPSCHHARESSYELQPSLSVSLSI